ncbi:hypothetical protein PDESU_03333 [Pontiella desulfatans]|uniref:Uncharacterized protein n=1 Tax=Pontiella desulfatans TaxID=2750659 RepID=A0A6C2U5R0_PONDE|nr:Cas9 inhibitor AcrIIA9 family protein [Pontiella desulfatans]VGO14764.1 hypothetical protein PDESU_03333 [Pontiella desulfatans]
MSTPKLNLTAENSTEQRILDYLIENASTELVAKINFGKKTLAGALDYARGEARSMAIDGCAVVDDDTVFGWIIHFFEEDEIKEGAKKPKTRVPGGVKAKPKPKPAKKEKPTGPLVMDLFTGEAVSAVGR